MLLCKTGFTPALVCFCVFFGQGVGLGLGAGNVTTGSASMGEGIKKKFALVTKKSDALLAGLNSQLPKWSWRCAPSAFPSC